MSSFPGAPSTLLGAGSGDEESLRVLDFVSREIPRGVYPAPGGARNDRLKPFFSNLLELDLRTVAVTPC